MTTTRNDRWRNNLGALRQYTERTGTSLVPTTHVETFNGENVALGAWVAYMRQRKRANALSSEQENALSALNGWRWEKQKPGPRYDMNRDQIIRERRKNGDRIVALSKEFGLSRQRIHQITRGEVRQ